jgi:uncharacterized protein (TIGR03492 family)
MLAGTRADAETNLLDLMAAASATARLFAEPTRLRFIFAVRDAVEPAALATEIAADPRLSDWRLAEAPTLPSGEGVVLRFDGPGGARVLLAKRRFADVLRLSKLVVGMAGTANEQAIGLGIPLVTVPSSGVQGESYVRMKMKYFGEAAVAAPRDPDGIARAVIDLLRDPARCARMAAAGRERMGEPGASAAIAGEIAAMLDASAGRRAA